VFGAGFVPIDGGGVVPGAGHFLAEENHDATLAALRDFLAAG
jgi:pimeloyl-ACP methyl ester carboxylesterase